MAAGQTVAMPGAPPGETPVAVTMAQQAMQDPATREMMKRHAAELGGHAVMLGKHYGHQGVMAFGDYIQQGPKGASVLCFMGGTATSVVGVMYVFGFLKALDDPLHYIIYVYMFAFGIATTCLEADPDRIGMMPYPFDMIAGPLTRGQAWLHREVKLLTELRGRGCFYLYQGTLMATQCVFCVMFLVGLFNALMGALCIAMSFGIQPDFEYLAASTGLSGEAQYSTVQQVGSDEETGETKMRLLQQNSTAPATVNMAPSVEAEFRTAEQAWAKSKDKLPGKACRALWALQNQALHGDCKEKKPSGMFNGNSKEQWRLWNELKGISTEDAKLMFIERLRKEKVSF